jgi:thiol-disulfide isomerase/thioredoxin
MFKACSIITLLLMGLVVLAGSVYILFFIDESKVQKRNNTPAAQALIIDESGESFTDKEGNPVSVNENFGNIMVVTSWASWCPQCIEGVQALGSVAEKYRDRDVVVLAVNRGEDKYTAERYLATVTLPDSVKIILDPSDHYFDASAGYAMPETIVYDENGEEKVHQRGNVNTEEVEKAIEELLR